MDPESDELLHISAYNYCENNPIILNDPDGEFPVWAIVSAAIDYGLQVYDNYNDGKTGVDAWTDINVVSVVGSAVNPLNKVKTVSTAAKMAKAAGEVVYEAVQNTFEFNVGEDSPLKIETDVKKVATKIAANCVAGQAGKKLYGSGSAASVKKANKGAQNAQNNLNRAQAKNSNASSAKTAQRVDKAKSAQQTARARQVRANMAHATVGRSEGATTTASKTIAKVATRKQNND